MSNTDIKMSDVFDLPVITDYSGVIFDNYCCAIGEVCGTLDQSRLVSHAINSYDALVEQNKVLHSALCDVLVEYRGLGGCKVLIEQCEKALEQAK